jgi:hypothetical protein
MLSSDVIIRCYHPMLSSDVITRCYHLMLHPILPADASELLNPGAIWAVHSTTHLVGDGIWSNGFGSWRRPSAVVTWSAADRHVEVTWSVADWLALRLVTWPRADWPVQPATRWLSYRAAGRVIRKVKISKAIHNVMLPTFGYFVICKWLLRIRSLQESFW